MSGDKEIILEMKVLIPYHPIINLKKGQVFSPKGRNMLITGVNGSGKSSFLHMLFESIRINQEQKNARKPFYSNQPFSYFYIRSNIKTKNRKRDIPLDYFLDILEIKDERKYEDRLFGRRVLFEAINNPDLTEIVGINESRYRSFIEGLKQELCDEKPGEDYKEKVNIFVELIKKYAKQISLPPEVIFETFKLAEEQKLSGLNNLFSNFFYVNIIGDLSDLSVSAFYQIPGGENNYSSRILKDGRWQELVYARWKTGDDKKILKNFNGSYQRNFKSSGQDKKAILEQILNERTEKRIILLDEPMDYLDEKSQGEYTYKIISLGKEENVQIALVSHDLCFNQTIRKESNWIEYKI